MLKYCLTSGIKSLSFSFTNANKPAIKEIISVHRFPAIYLHWQEEMGRIFWDDLGQEYSNGSFSSWYWRGWFLKTIYVTFIGSRTEIWKNGHVQIWTKGESILNQLQSKHDRPRWTPWSSTQCHFCVPLSIKKLGSRAFQRYMTCIYRAM